MLVKGSKLPLRDIALYGFLPGFLKKAIYRLKGYRIPKSVKLGIGSVIVGNDVQLGEDVHIGPLTFIVGRTIYIGPRVQIGMMTFISVSDFSVSQGTRINNQVVIGGMASPRSSFRMGANGILMEWSFVNTTEPVRIGDNVGIGGHCLFFTHGMWPNAFEGYPYKFAPITIEDDVWLAWRVSVLPGVTIGRGTIVSSDACVTSSLPEGALTGGVPARVLRDNFSYKSEMDSEARNSLLANLLEEFEDWLKFHDFTVRKQTRDGEIWMDVSNGQKAHQLIAWMESTAKHTCPSLTTEAMIVSVGAIDDNLRAQIEARNIPWIDLKSRERSERSNDLAEEAEEFLRRRGMRVLLWKSSNH